MSLHAPIEQDSASFEGMFGTSSQMREVYALTRQVAGSSATVLLTGETGTGKELIARAVHRLSHRASGPFIRVNCGALAESLLESELFGHVKGAFTSANENRTGRFEAAHGGTIFLDEINSVSHQLQVKLLRILQEHEFERVGDTKTIQVDCRIVAATNRDLLDEIDEGRFREDLYYRLNVIPIDLPPLRERSDDVPELSRHFAKIYASQNRRPVPAIDDEAYSYLKSYAWPGNVRELQNYIERAIVLGDGNRITVDLLPPHVRGVAPARRKRPQGSELEDLCRDFVAQRIEEVGHDGALHDAVVSYVEKELIANVLRSCHGVQTKAATKLGINRNTLHKKIDEYQLDETG
ncbi:sigma-54 interaction domain-containing protein [Stratiformator vulcanicus]|uniref:Transcriptional regulatory protein ZraR n=1 Tax=Stratiformator vulcanicus TaxID=2527980 RepID=A0A517R2B0_9PLAN|nr:sigma-54 dependent transcriptional regulator [Stratiformator vulcanicus]QDT38019.1 Transcriptional regulatory protein ZraR [Stratiformator vulcanicus]